MCDQCKLTGSWNVLEKFLSIQKSNKGLEELNLLKKTLRPIKNLKETWEDIKRKGQSIQDLSLEEYNIILKKFSLPVKTQDLKILF